ncbi:MAG: peptidylprolyl isomerase, partial [Parasutterella sp.]|nr:peptidylprolyl isomerase [Parasutterella sp.]
EVPLPSFDALKPQIQNLAAQRQAQQYMADLMKNAKIAEAAPAKKKSSK